MRKNAYINNINVNKHIGGLYMQTLKDFTNLEYYNKMRCADGDVVQYIAKSVKNKKHYIITVKNDTVLKVQHY